MLLISADISTITILVSANIPIVMSDIAESVSQKKATVFTHIFFASHHATHWSHSPGIAIPARMT
jgi:hypothetical protein